MAKKRQKQKPKKAKATKPKVLPKKPPAKKEVVANEQSLPLIDPTKIDKPIEETEAEVLPIAKQEQKKAKLADLAEKHKLKLQIVFFILFTLFLVSADSWLNTERKVFDWLTFFNSVPEESKQVVIVKIDENDFSQLFEKKSPLDPNQVTKIIEAISTAEPEVIGIDILTSDEKHCEYVPKDYGFPIVWASEPIKTAGKFVAIKPPLAGQPLALNNSSALPESAKDSDGVNRIFRRKWNVDGQEYSTFAWEIYKLAYPEESKLKEENMEDYYIRFTGNSHQEIPAGEVLKWEVGETKKHLEGKIVILGGMYGDARDTQLIPFESVFGVQLNATIIETEIQGNPQKPISGIWKLILNLIAFPLFAIIFFRYKFVKALIIAILIILFAIFSISFFKYGISSLILLIPVFLWTLFLALLDLTMDKYKETGSGLLDLGKNSFSKIFSKKD